MTRREWYRRQSDADLVRLALAASPDGARYWGCVRALQARLTEAVFRRAVASCRHRRARVRQFGCDVLAQLGTRDAAGVRVAPFRARSLPALRRCLRDRHPGVVESAVYALDHLDVRFRSRLLSGLVRHPDRRVREAVAHAVGFQTDRLAIRLLIELTRDRDGETRNWARFGLHPLTSTTRSTDTAEIRDALLAGVRDRHREARGELVGLALRHDERVLEPLSRELRERPVSYLAVEAAQALGHPSLRSALRRLKPREAWIRRLLRDAIAACGPRPRRG
jgi:hypothetical protein